MVRVLRGARRILLIVIAAVWGLAIVGEPTVTRPVTGAMEKTALAVARLFGLNTDLSRSMAEQGVPLGLRSMDRFVLVLLLLIILVAVWVTLAIARRVARARRDASARQRRADLVSAANSGAPVAAAGAPRAAAPARRGAETVEQLFTFSTFESVSTSVDTVNEWLVNQAIEIVGAEMSFVHKQIFMKPTAGLSHMMIRFRDVPSEIRRYQLTAFEKMAVFGNPQRALFERLEEWQRAHPDQQIVQRWTHGYSYQNAAGRVGTLAFLHRERQ